MEENILDKIEQIADSVDKLNRKVEKIELDFDEADKNKDGVITKDEWIIYANENAKRQETSLARTQTYSLVTIISSAVFLLLSVLVSGIFGLK
jgi:outer membrane murein-binding lipoprotein Lpp